MEGRHLLKKKARLLQVFLSPYNDLIPSVQMTHLFLYLFEQN